MNSSLCHENLPRPSLPHAGDMMPGSAGEGSGLVHETYSSIMLLVLLKNIYKDPVNDLLTTV